MSAIRKPVQQEKKRYTYADYCSWDDDEGCSVNLAEVFLEV